MIETRKGRPDGDTSKRPGGLLEQTAPATRKQCTTILDILPQGAENAVSSKQLARLCGCGTVRDLQSKIEKERASGALILSTCHGSGGYFRPADGQTGRDELQAFCRTLTARAKRTFAAMKPARIALQHMEGQLSMQEKE